MLEIRPNCECCDKDLPVDSLDVMICTYECTFCKNCVVDILENVCPNCGGGFATRPIRPAKEWRPGLSRENQLPSSKRIHSKYTRKELKEFSLQVKSTAPRKR
ncbi:MAG: hypothetical protein ACJAS9_001781 [Polaribacter sp.]|jgi:hypothetical protein